MIRASYAPQPLLMWLAEAKESFVKIAAMPAECPVARVTADVEAVVGTLDRKAEICLGAASVRVVADLGVRRRKRFIGTPD